MKLYISDLGLISLGIFYLPIVVWLIWRIIRSPSLMGAKKAGAILLILLAAYAIPLGDVTINSIAMNKACERAGVHVYKKVPVDGYFRDNDGPATLKRFPYSYVETINYSKASYQDRLNTSLGKSHGGATTRYERRTDGSIAVVDLPHSTAEYEVLVEDRSPAPELGVSRVLRYFARNRLTGEVVGEDLIFNPMHGWVDRITLNRWFGASLPGCTGRKGVGSSNPFGDRPPDETGGFIPQASYYFPHNVLIPFPVKENEK